jgi:hypothetical protein
MQSEVDAPPINHSGLAIHIAHNSECVDTAAFLIGIPCRDHDSVEPPQFEDQISRLGQNRRLNQTGWINSVWRVETVVGRLGHLAASSLLEVHRSVSVATDSRTHFAVLD